MIISLLLLNLIEGGFVYDLEILKADEGFCRISRPLGLCDLSRKKCRKQERRWRKKRRDLVPSPSAVSRYLEALHEEGEEGKFRPGKAFVPKQNNHIERFVTID